MKKVALLIITSLLCFNFSSSAQSKKTQSYIEHTPLAHHKVALDIIRASKKWIKNFNKGKSKKCVEGYAPNATMRAMPFGVKTGKKEIMDFWGPFIESGASNLVYTNVKIEIVNESTALLSANWSMNVGKGIIYEEKWRKIDNKWLLTYDDFEVLEKFKTPKINETPATASHEVLEAVIKASMAWTIGFNTKNSTMCANGYAKNASLSPSPFPSVHTNEDIRKFWDKLITDGATNLTYHNPTFEVITPERVKLSSLWSMNIGEGKIYQEKWIKENGKWLLGYDYFRVLKQY